MKTLKECLIDLIQEMDIPVELPKEKDECGVNQDPNQKSQTTKPE